MNDPQFSDGPQLLGLSIIEDDYFLPQGGPAAKARFLGILADPKLTKAYISAYSLTLEPCFAEIIAADARGVEFDILLDHSQSTGKAEAPLIANLVKTLKNSHITITTAGVGSANKSAIYHWKAMVLITTANSNDGPLCWEGSTNFSAGGWDQGNSARVFSSGEWAKMFIDQFLQHKAWARQYEPQYQDKGLAATSGIMGASIIPLNDPSLVYYGPHPCQVCDPNGLHGTIITKAGNGAPDSLEFDYPREVTMSTRMYPNSPGADKFKWNRHQHI